MSEAPAAEMIYSAKYVSTSLGISASMLRRYAISYEEVTGQKIRSDPRDGRQYTSDQLATLLEAKALVDSNAGMSTTTALRIALGDTGLAVKMSEPPRSQELSAEALGRAVAEGVRQAQEPLLLELQAVRAQLERIEGQGLIQRPPESLPNASEPARAVQGPESTQLRRGGLVRAAERIEGWLGKVLGR